MRRARPQNGTELRSEQVPPAQHHADAAPAEEWVGFRADLHVGQALVAADVQRADGQLTPAQRLGDGAIGGRLFLFVRRRGTPQKQELGTQHPHALRAPSQCFGRFGHAADVGENPDAPAIARGGWLVAFQFRRPARRQPLLAAAFERACPVRIGRDPNHPLLAIHSHHGSVGQRGKTGAQPRHHGNSQGPRQDRAVRAGAARLQAQAQNHRGVEALDLGRSQIVRREDGRRARQLHRAALTREPAQHPCRHVRHIRRPCAQVGVRESAQAAGQSGGFRLPGGLRGHPVRRQHARDSVNQLRVFEEQQLGIENAGLIGANVSFGPFVQCPGFFPRVLDSGHQALPLGLGIGAAPEGDFHGGGTQFEQRPDGDARCRRDAAELPWRRRNEWRL